MWLKNPGIYIGCCIFLFVVTYKDFRKIRISGYAQGTTYHITYYAADSIVTQQQIDSILDKIDSSLSLYKSYSLINQFNVSERGVEMDKHFKNVLNKSIETYRATNGLFDITVQPLVQAWGFGVTKSDTIPTGALLNAIKECVGSDLLQVKDNYLLKKKSCVRIDMNGVAQGYSVDVIADFLEKNRIVNYIVELGGELRVKGRNHATGEKMKIGIESPSKSAFDDESLENVISVDKGAVTTSGSYRKFYESNGKKITHLIDPTTGYPVQNELISVTICANDAITADAYDNALMLMGLDKALQFVQKRKDLEAYFIYQKSNGEIADTASRGFYKVLVH